MGYTRNEDLSPYADELLLWIDNTGELYSRHTVPLMRLLQARYKRGEYNQTDALARWKTLAEIGAADYYAANRTMPYDREGNSVRRPIEYVSWMDMFDPKDIDAVGARLTDRFHEELEIEAHGFVGAGRRQLRREGGTSQPSLFKGDPDEVIACGDEEHPRWVCAALDALVVKEGLDMEAEEAGYGFNGVTAYRVTGEDDEEWLLFKSFNDAEEYAVGYMVQTFEEDPENYGDFLSSYMTMSPTDINVFLSDEESYQREMREESDMDEDEIEEELDEWRSDVAARLKDDPKQYFEDEYGEWEPYKNVMQIDFAKAAQDAVDMDGVGHHLSSYDGEQIDLDRGAVAYRQN